MTNSSLNKPAYVVSSESHLVNMPSIGDKASSSAVSSSELTTVHNNNKAKSDLLPFHKR